MIVNKTQMKFHNAARKTLHEKAAQFIEGIGDAHTMEVDKHIQHRDLTTAIFEMRELNELMNHTVDENEHLKNAFADWLNPKKDDVHVAETIMHFTKH